MGGYVRVTAFSGTVLASAPAHASFRVAWGPRLLGQLLWPIGVACPPATLAFTVQAIGPPSIPTLSVRGSDGWGCAARWLVCWPSPVRVRQRCSPGVCFCAFARSACGRVCLRVRGVYAERVCGRVSLGVLRCSLGVLRVLCVSLSCAQAVARSGTQSDLTTGQILVLIDIRTAEHSGRFAMKT